MILCPQSKKLRAERALLVVLRNLDVFVLANDRPIS